MVNLILLRKLYSPRYHQYDVVKKILADVKDKGAGVNYLIEHLSWIW